MAGEEYYPGGMFMALGVEKPDGTNLVPPDGMTLYPINAFEEHGNTIWARLTIERPDRHYRTGAVVDDPLVSDPRFAEVRLRPDQTRFRAAVFALHGARCVVTGCDLPALLDAAHLPGKDWRAGENRAIDGIPLRADLHRALDAGLIRLDAQHRLAWVDETLAGLYGGYLGALNPDA